ncbi:MAG: asparagine synthase-related protein [Legionella sp.]
MHQSDVSINASKWHKEIWQHYVVYSPDPVFIDFLKQQLALIAKGDPLKIGFSSYYKPFACLIIHTVTNEYFLVRDHFGMEPFYYSLISKDQFRLCFGSNLPDVLVHLKNPTQDRQEIIKIMTDMCNSSAQYSDQTLYEHVFRVTPGEIISIRFAHKAKVQHHPYWSLKPGTSRIRYACDADYDAHFSFLLQEALAVSCEQAPTKTALEFSGGIDSSVLLTALHAQKKTTQLFMHVGDNTEERHYGDSLLQEIKSDYPIHYVDADTFDIATVLNQYKLWFAGGAPYTFFMFANNIHQAIKQKGCQILLSGFGGDECVSSHASLRTYGAEIGYKALWNELKLINKKESIIRRGLKTLAFSQPQLLLALQLIQSHASLQDNKKTRLIYKPYRSLQEKEYDKLQGNLSYHVRMRIEYSAIVARNMGFTYQYPLLYPPLVEFCFSLPSNQKRRQGQNRLLMRRYLANHLPSGLYNTHKKCGEILPGTLPKSNNLYSQGQLASLLTDLPHTHIHDHLLKKGILTPDNKFHVDLFRYMLK